MLFGALVFAVFRQGAYHQGQHIVFVVLIGSAGVLLLAEQHAQALSPRVLTALSPLLASSLVSTVVSEDRSDVASTFVLIGVLAVAIIAGACVPRPNRPLAIGVVSALGTIVAFTAIWGVVAHSSPWGRVTEGVWRGSSSLTYANGAAAVLGPLAVIAFVRATREESWRYATTTVLLMIGFASTQSRGGALALAVAIVPTIAHVGLRESARSAVPILAGLAVGMPPVLIIASASEPRPVLAVVLVATALLVTRIGWAGRHRLTSPLAWFLGSVAVVGSVFGLTPLSAAVGARLTFRSGTTAGGESAAVLFGDRAQGWVVAWEQFRERPVVGHGPGAVDLTWVDEGRTFRLLFAHNEYLELAVTHGLVGIGALVASAMLLRRALKLRLNARTVPYSIGLLVFMAHSAVDFLWHIPALPVLFAFLVGLWGAEGAIDGSSRLGTKRSRVYQRALRLKGKYPHTQSQSGRESHVSSS